MRDKKINVEEKLEHINKLYELKQQIGQTIIFLNLEL
jgi:hypothetical protein